jgi:hypothetical protein
MNHNSTVYNASVTLNLSKIYHQFDPLFRVGKISYSGIRRATENPARIHALADKKHGFVFRINLTIFVRQPECKTERVLV